MVKTAFVFPGQGSQTVGMLSEFIPSYPIVKDLFTKASDILGYDLLQLILEGPEEQLNQTEHTQVAMLTADVAVFKLLLQEGIPFPNMMAGHSLGEYAALVASDALNFVDALLLVKKRAEVMQKAVPIGQGAMAAIVGLSNEQVERLCESVSEVNQIVTPANFNAIGQVVVAGHTRAVELLISLALENDARLAKMIPVSVPCHCPLLKDAANEFANSLAATHFSKPSAQVVANVDVGIYQSPEEIRTKLKEQLYSPVRWVETIECFKNKGIELIIESGPAKVLSGLIKRIDKSLNTKSVYDTISLKQEKMSN